MRPFSILVFALLAACAPRARAPQPAASIAGAGAVASVDPVEELGTVEAEVAAHVARLKVLGDLSMEPPVAILNILSAEHFSRSEDRPEVRARLLSILFKSNQQIILARQLGDRASLGRAKLNKSRAKQGLRSLG